MSPQVQLSQKVILPAALKILLKQVLLGALLLLCVLDDLPSLTFRNPRPLGLDLLLNLGRSALGCPVVAVVDLLKEEVELRGESSGGQELPSQGRYVHDACEGQQSVGQKLVLKQGGPKLGVDARHCISKLCPAVASGIQGLVACEVVWGVAIYRFL